MGKLLKVYRSDVGMISELEVLSNAEAHKIAVATCREFGCRNVKDWGSCVVGYTPNGKESIHVSICDD
ncbi:MAG: hypothetical protein J6S67_07760 [Methanobrevibacter sp.]|nr:hypothetical protein [Methanobrevibacter sp.]